MQCEIQKVPLPFPASLVSLAERFGVTPVLLTVLLAGEESIFKKIHCKNLSASFTFIMWSFFPLYYYFLIKTAIRSSYPKICTQHSWMDDAA